MSRNSSFNQTLLSPSLYMVHLPHSTHLRGHKPTTHIVRTKVVVREIRTGKHNKIKRKVYHLAVHAHIGINKLVLHLFLSIATYASQYGFVGRPVSGVWLIFNFGVINKFAIGDGIIILSR